MPIYEYECKQCGIQEINHKITEPPREECETCGGPIRRLISATNFALKGGGWYADGYASTKKDSGGGDAPAASCGANACGAGGCGTAEA